MDATGFRIVGRPYYTSIMGYYARLPWIRSRLRAQAKALIAEHDLVIVRAPAPAASYIAAAAHVARIPLAMLVAGNVETASRWVAGRRGLAAWPGRCIAGLLRRQERALARHSVFVGAWGPELREIFRPYCPRVELCEDPIIEQQNLARRNDTCAQSPIRLLRVSRLLPNKGLEYLLEALARLCATGQAFHLDIAGGHDDPAYADSLQRCARRLRVDQCVTYHGPVSFGEELFKLYRAADIHVISSLSEGLPRIIAEGRAFCLPTVATAVGGIPSVVHDAEDGLLVPPADADRLAHAIRRLIDDGDLRRRIIARSFELAQRSTAEYHAERLARLIAAAAGFCHDASDAGAVDRTRECT